MLHRSSLPPLRWCVLALLSCLFWMSVGAQTLPQYRLTVLDAGVTPDLCAVRFSVSVSNSGGPAVETVQLALSTVSGQLTRVDVTPLNTGATAAYQLVADLTQNNLPTGPQPFFIDFYLNGVEWGDSPTLERNLTIPAPPPQCYNRAPQGGGLGSFIVTLPGLGISIDLLNPTPEQLALMVGVVLIVLVLMLCVVWLIRRMGRRPPVFGNQLAPYAMQPPPPDPRSEAAIRYGWQLNAPNNLINVAATTQAVAAVKLLTNTDGVYLDGWAITAVRLSQYDQYGRVARSVTLAPHKMVRSLERLAHSRPRKNQSAEQWIAQAERRVTPLARYLANTFAKRITPRSAVLPVALDIRLKGVHGEVKIMFRLFQYDGNQWLEIKHWEPDMTVTTERIHEIYTYTLHGQTPGENFRDYKRRLPLDIARALVDFVTPPGIE